MLTDDFKQGEVFSLKGRYFEVEEITNTLGKMKLREVSKEEAQKLFRKNMAVSGSNASSDPKPNRKRRRWFARKDK